MRGAELFIPVVFSHRLWTHSPLLTALLSSWINPTPLLSSQLKATPFESPSLKLPLLYQLKPDTGSPLLTVSVPSKRLIPDTKPTRNRLKIIQQHITRVISQTTVRLTAQSAADVF